ncbi:unnamed protein product [Sphagnum jensenii]|uniref:Heparan-alpha-glucosaminide N-acetyltransferase catalytic domain-containing protein n=1 Tax=Sphagnum jensenii TaxID=128206 RepID=A0ABP0VY28_9BRYO
MADEEDHGIVEEWRGAVCNGAETAADLRRPLVEGSGFREQHRDEGTGILGVPAASSSRSMTKKARLASLDVFRGLSIAIMILVDQAGGKWPSINHSPWNGVTLADFVMPFFLFIVGVALALTYQRIGDKKMATQKAVGRVLNLCILGIILQGGYFHGLSDLTYGVDVQRIRWCGILQRIAFAFLLVALCEIWALRGPCHNIPEGTLEICKVYYVHWVVAAAIVVTYLALLYGVNVPDWEFLPPSLPSNSTLIQASSALTVKCGVRGDVGPACNVVGYLDRNLLGINHLYQHPVYQRTPDCSMKSPDYGPLPPGAPNWCRAPFDPEGILSSLSAVISCFIGLHFGHVLVHHKDHYSRVWHWFWPSLGLLTVGLTLHLFGMRFNKPLYSFSYVCFMGGAAGLVLTGFYLLVDVHGCKLPTVLLEWMGTNALLMFTLVASDVFPAVLQGFYWGSPDNNLVAITGKVFEDLLPSPKQAELASVLSEIFTWSLVAGVLHRMGLHWRL